MLSFKNLGHEMNLGHEIDKMNRHHQASSSLVFAPRVNTNSNDPAVLKKALMHMEAQVLHMRRRLQDIQKQVVGRDALDPVSGLLNRDGLFVSLDVQVSRIKAEESQGGTLILADIDNFGDVLEKHGQYVLSLCIRQVADMIMEALFYSGEIAYLGDGEFAVLLPDVSKDQILDDVQLLRSRLDRISFEWDGKKVQVKSSVGLHAYMTSDCLARLLKPYQCKLSRKPQKSGTC